MPCADNGTEYCGAGSRLNMYQRGNGTIPAPTTTTGGSTTAPTATGGPQIKQAIGNWLFQGCYTEATNGRALSKSTFANDSMTLESCAAFCSGSSMFGVEYGRECMFNKTFPEELTNNKIRLLWKCSGYWKYKSYKSRGL